MTGTSLPFLKLIAFPEGDEKETPSTPVPVLFPPPRCKMRFIETLALNYSGVQMSGKPQALLSQMTRKCRKFCTISRSLNKQIEINQYCFFKTINDFLKCKCPINIMRNQFLIIVLFLVFPQTNGLVNTKIIKT